MTLFWLLLHNCSFATALHHNYYWFPGDLRQHRERVIQLPKGSRQVENQELLIQMINRSLTWEALQKEASKRCESIEHILCKQAITEVLQPAVVSHGLILQPPCKVALDLTLLYSPASAQTTLAQVSIFQIRPYGFVQPNYICKLHSWKVSTLLIFYDGDQEI